jgi:signal transduction histidine kinase
MLETATGTRFERGGPPRDARARMLAAQVELLASQLPALAGGTTVLAVGVAYILGSHGMAIGRIAAWLAALLLVTGVRLVAWRIYTAVKPPPASATRWAAVLCALSFAAGCVWGSLGVLFFAPDDPFTLALLTMMLTAIIASALSSLGPYWPAHLCFGIPCALPFCLECLMASERTVVVLGVLAVFFLLFAETFARSIARSVERSLQLRFDNLGLVDELRHARDVAQAAHAAKSRLLAAVSHDLRQPLHGMGLLAQEIGEAASDPHTRPEEVIAAVGLVAGRMRADLDEMRELVDRLLEAARLADGTLTVHDEPCEVTGLLRWMGASFESVTAARGLRLRVRTGREPQWVRTDPVLLKSAVRNVVGNAVKYTQGGAGVLLACRLRQGRVCIEVWDSGIGIPQEEINAVLGEYYRASNADDVRQGVRAFGLGLSIVSRVCVLLRIRLLIRSRLGRGTVVVLDLPRA